MQNEKIHLERIKRFITRLKDSVHSGKTELTALVTQADDPIPHTSLSERQWNSISRGQVWGKVWSSAWFQVKGLIPAELAGKNVGLWFDCDGEACVWKDGTPWQGLTPKVDWYHNAAKYFVPLSAQTGESFEILIEAAANDLFGKGKDEYALRECALVAFDEELYQLSLDIELLFDLANALHAGNVRRAKILYSLNRICNIYAEGKGLQQAQDITEKLLAQPANASALTAYSVGHAHLDLAWLWPVRESRRKGGRTFANALRLLETYPDYIFGASQAQLYQWIKDDYPGLYAQVQKAFTEGRWDVQGASWVEFDTNLIAGESIIRQFLYGKRFFREEFGTEPDYLWLPDCFGFSANLPQFLRGCGVNYFVTQKLSWNESNVFPHHLFFWQGIDGSEVRAHQLPTNDYNFSNNPSAFLATEARFAQAELTDAFLNLYGIGDGGGGPTRNHIEYGLRQRDLEGVSRFRFSTASEFLQHYAGLDAELLPRMFGELYLEFHRGTYTTQARMKQDNFRSEKLLQAAEALSALTGVLTHTKNYPEELRPIWQDTLLMQFHDILPGSSIGMVYDDASALSTINHRKLQDFIAGRLNSLTIENDSSGHLVFNLCGSAKLDWIKLPAPNAGLIPVSADAEIRGTYLSGSELHILLKVPAWGVARISYTMSTQASPAGTSSHAEGESWVLENEYLKAIISPGGSIRSIWDKELQCETLAGASNLLQLWEDEPNNWGAWDINHFYRETTPQQAVNVNTAEPFLLNPDGSITQHLHVSSSIIIQHIELPPGERYLSVSHEIDWQEQHKMLRAAFQPDVLCETATCGVQMGSVQRPVNPRNAWEAARFEFPAQGFVDLSDAEHGCSLICPAKYGYSLHGNRMEVALLRSPADVDPTADIGLQSHHYALYCHAVPYSQAQVQELSLAIGSVLQTSPGNSVSNLPGGPLFALEHGKLILSGIKPAEDGKGIILRLFEPLGRTASDSLFSAFPVAKLHKCNMLEEVLETLTPEAKITAKPFEIITLRVELI